MQDVRGAVAVVTGGASGIGKAMGACFGRAGMKVVLADVEEPVLAATATELREEQVDVTAVTCDVSSYASVEALRDQAIDAYGAVHVLCNNAGVGSGAEGRIWDHGLNDWAWCMGVNVWGVIHGVKAFLPHMLVHGQEGHVVNTSSGNGGVAPLGSTPIYAMSKAAVVTITECLYNHLTEEGASIGASVLFPGPHMLDTGLWTSWRNRPEDLPPERPRSTKPLTLDDIKAAMAAKGIDLPVTPVAEVAERTLEAILANRFWILPKSERTDASIQRRASSMLERANPDYFNAIDLPPRKPADAAATDS